MKIPVLNSIRASLDYLEDDEVNDQLDTLLKALDDELSEQGYEATLSVEKATADLDTAVSDAEESASDPDADPEKVE